MLFRHTWLITSPHFLNQIKSDSKLPISRAWEIKIPSLQGLPPSPSQALEALCSLQHPGRSPALLRVQAHVYLLGAPLFSDWWHLGNNGEVPRLRLRPEGHHTRYSSKMMLLSGSCEGTGTFPLLGPTGPLPPSQCWKTISSLSLFEPAKPSAFKQGGFGGTNSQHLRESFLWATLPSLSQPCIPEVFEDKCLTTFLE